MGLMFPKIPTKKKRMRHPKSILHNKEDRTCFLCMLLDDNYNPHILLHEHHIFNGDPNRSHSEEHGLKVYLCLYHHETGKVAVHTCKETRELLEKIGQRAFEETHTREEFMEIFGENYLEEPYESKDLAERQK